MNNKVEAADEQLQNILECMQRNPGEHFTVVHLLPTVWERLMQYGVELKHEKYSSDPDSEFVWRYHPRLPK
jgi:hypothetical protein